MPRSMPGLRIVLARHGRPDWNNKVSIRGVELADHIRGRDQAPIDPSFPPSDQLRELARTSEVIVASTLRRSYESAELLAPDAPLTVDAMFREVFTPTAFKSAVRLPAKAWGLIARVRWLGGWSPGVETYPEAKLRAHRAANTLEMLSEQRGNVLLEAHGIMNGLIAGWLRRNGWKGPFFRGRRYWSYMVYEKSVSR
jgi:broad specificity phosphatase PhoE